MATKKKVVETVTPEGIVDTEVDVEINDETGEEITVTVELVEVQLAEAYQRINSVISKGIINFVDGKATVSQAVADDLRTQGFIQ